MVKILDAKVEWYKPYANDPSFKLLVEDLPNPDDFRYEEKNGLYVAEKDGMFSFYYYQRPGQGFGGWTFNIKMKDGSEKQLVGPWSSRSGCVNQLGFGLCGEINYTKDEKSFHRGYTFIAGRALSLDLLKEAVKLAQCHVVKIAYLGNDLRLPDSSEEQSLFIYNDKKISCHIDVKLPSNTEFTFCPSLDPFKLVKEK